MLTASGQPAGSRTLQEDDTYLGRRCTRTALDSCIHEASSIRSERCCCTAGTAAAGTPSAEVTCTCLFFPKMTALLRRNDGNALYNGTILSLAVRARPPPRPHANVVIHIPTKVGSAHRQRLQAMQLNNLIDVATCCCQLQAGKAISVTVAATPTNLNPNTRSGLAEDVLLPYALEP